MPFIGRVQNKGQTEDAPEGGKTRTAGEVWNRKSRQAERRCGKSECLLCFLNIKRSSQKGMWRSLEKEKGS